MTQITKQHFDQQIKKLATKKDLEQQTKELKTYTDQQTDQLAQVVNTAFQDQHDYMEKAFVNVGKEFASVNNRLQVIETKLDRALYTELTHLEARVKRLEQRVGIKK